MELAVEIREQFGKSNRRLRAADFVPAELYGHGIPNIHLKVGRDEFMKAFRTAGENTIINLVLQGETRPVLVHAVQSDYITGEVSHVDFYQVRADEKITAKIPIEFLGEAPAAKEQNAFLNKALTEIEVESLPANLPHSFILKLDWLKELNASLYVKDLVVPKGVKVLVDPETVVVTAVPPRTEEVGAAPVDVSAVKVETEEKKVERAGEKIQSKDEE